MRQFPIRRSTAIAAVLVAVVLACACDETPLHLPDVSYVEEVPPVKYVRDLNLNLSLLLAGTASDLVASVKVQLADGLVVDSVTLYRVDETGAAVEAVQQLRDDGDPAQGDLVAADAVYTTTVVDLEYAQPQELYFSVRTAAVDTLSGETAEAWSRRLKLDVISTELVFGMGPVATPQGVFASQVTSLTVIAGLLVADSLSVSSVRVFRVSAAGDSIDVLGSLMDDGNLDNGDEIQLDGNFTGILSGIFVVAPQMYRMRALAEAVSPETGRVFTTWSPVLEISVDWPPAQGSMDMVVGNLGQVEDLYAQAVADGMSDDEAKAAAVEWMESQDYVVESYISPDGATVWTLYADGLEAGAYLPHGGAPVLGGASASNQRAGSPMPLKAEAGTPSRPPRNPVFSLDRAMDNPDEVHSNMVSLLSPAHSWIESLGETDPTDAVADLFESKSCPWAFDVMHLTDAGADVQAFADLFRSGAVSILTHGTLVAGGEICLMTGEPVSLEGAEAWFWDLYNPMPTMAVLSFDGRVNFAVKSSFLAKYNAIMPNSIVLIAACQGLLNSSLRQSSLASGTGFLAGFDGTVGLEFASGAIEEFWTGVLSGGDLAGDAFAAVSAHADPANAATSFVSFGNGALALSSDFQNGNFELQSLAAWHTEGDGRVIGQLGSEFPTDGRYMGIISTGLGYTLSTGEIFQKVCIPTDNTTLRLDYNFFSEEVVEWCGTGFQDFFEVSLRRDGEEAETVISYITIDDVCGDVTPAGVVFDQGPTENDEGVYKTGWLELEIDCSLYAGETVWLRFAAGDIGDSIFDSAILIDAIEFVAPPF